MLIQVHMLQNYAPSNLNRDDTGAPKDAIFGGVRRGRISSQCLKRSIRKSAVFAEEFEKDGLLASRTKLLPRLIKEELEKLGTDDATVKAIIARVPAIGKKARGEEESNESEEQEPATGADEAKLETRQLIFIGQDERRTLAEKLRDLYKQLGPKAWAKVDLNTALKPDKDSKPRLPRSVDIALFGRMTTSEAFEDVQAASQVAHAFSTNALAQEFDYYTAVDDISGESGAGMIGDVEFNSSTYYKYVNVHWEQLLENLGSDVDVARRAILALVEAAAKAQPSGKQNSFAAHSLPDLMLVEVSTRNLPVSYANAFLKPARPSGDQTLMDVSVQQLADYIERVTKTFNLSAQRAFTATREYALPDATVLPSLTDLCSWLGTHLPG